MSRRIEVSDYLLGELSPEDLLEAERLMREDPGFRADIERLRPVVSQIRELPPHAWEELEPPPLRMPADARPAGRAPSAPRSSAPRFGFLRDRISLRPAIAAACSLALLAVGIGAGLALDSGGGGNGEVVAGQSVSLEPIGTADAGATGTAMLASSVTPASSGSGEATLTLTGMRPSAPGTYYELWLLNTPTDLVSLGSFQVPKSGDTTITVPLPESPSRYRYLDISVELDDGDPGHSGKSVMRSPA